MENIEWDPPIISFRIERHGAAAMGSSWAEMYRWTLNTTTKTATCSEDGYRQLWPNQPRLNVKPIAEEIAQSILAHKIDDRLKWNDDGSVRLVMGGIIPDDAAQQTVIGRRKRFRKVLEPQLIHVGWNVLRANNYAPPTT